jgi:hypothetical protein
MHKLLEIKQKNQIVNKSYNRTDKPTDFKNKKNQITLINQ